MKKPLISIVTPCFNGEKYLGRFLESVLSQTYPYLELVLVNDGSTDNTEGIVDIYKTRFNEKGIRFVYQFQKKGGQAAALNRGLKLFTGDYISWVDSDDELLPEYIEKKVEFLEKNQQYAFCYGKSILVNESDPNSIIKVVGERVADRKKNFFEDVLYVHNVFFSGYLVRTVDLDKVIQNREIYTGIGGQNAQLLLPLAWYFGEPGYVGDSIYKYYLRDDSHSHSLTSSEAIIQQLERYESILLNTIERIPDEEIRKYTVKVKRYYARQCFGNAVDTMRVDLIQKYFFRLCRLGNVQLHDIALFLKYSARVLL